MTANKKTKHIHTAAPTADDSLRHGATWHQALKALLSIAMRVAVAIVEGHWCYVDGGLAQNARSLNDFCLFRSRVRVILHIFPLDDLRDVHDP